MRPTRRQLLAMTVSTVAVAGCAGDGDATDTDDEGASGPATDTATASPTETPEQTAGSGDATVRVDSHPDHGEILVDAEGMALYMFDSDTQGAGESTCYDGCAEAWPPLTVETESAATADSDVTAELTTFEREDGSLQVAADGWPLYYFANDESPGDANGQGANDVWWLLRPDGSVVRPESTATATPTSTPDVRVRSHPDHGEILVDAEGMTLYMFDSDTQGAGESTCSGGCAEAWPPLTVENEPTAGEGVTAELTTFERENGDTQVAADGWPLYYFANDESPGDANGQGANDVWWLLRPDGSVVRSESTTDGTDTDTETGGGGYGYSVHEQR